MSKIVVSCPECHSYSQTKNGKIYRCCLCGLQFPLEKAFLRNRNPNLGALGRKMKHIRARKKASGSGVVAGRIEIGAGSRWGSTRLG